MKKSNQESDINVTSGPEIPKDTTKFKDGDLFICTKTGIVYEFKITKKKIYTKTDICDKKIREFVETNKIVEIPKTNKCCCKRCSDIDSESTCSKQEQNDKCIFCLYCNYFYCKECYYSKKMP